MTHFVTEITSQEAIAINLSSFHIDIGERTLANFMSARALALGKRDANVFLNFY